MPLATITGTSVLNWCSTHTELLPLTGVGGYSNEPGVSIINDALSEIIKDPNDWKFNRQELDPTVAPLITCTNKQDYLFAGASAFCLAQTISNTSVQSCGAGIALTSNSGITVSGGVVTVNTLETHRFVLGAKVYLVGTVFTTGTAANYNATYTDDGNQTTWGNGFVITGVTATSFTFAAVAGQNNSDVGGAPGFGISNGGTVQLQAFGWLAESQMLELNNNSSPPNYRHLKTRRTLPRWSKCADPEQVCVLSNLGTGVLKLRFVYTPSSDIWAVGLVYQAAAPVVSAINAAGTFSPIPDEFGFLIRQAVLYRCYRYMSNDSRANVEYEKLQSDIKRALGADQSEESNVYLEPEESLSDLPGPYFVGF